MEFTFEDNLQATKASGEGTVILPKLAVKEQFVGKVRYLFPETSTREKIIFP